MLLIDFFSYAVNYFQLPYFCSMEKMFADQTFTKEHFKTGRFERGEYDQCIFQHGDLQAADFSARRNHGA